MQEEEGSKDKKVQRRESQGVGGSKEIVFDFNCNFNLDFQVPA